MQKDCHYYGTFLLARLAGFDFSEAKEIAWAAQTVDMLDFDKIIDLLMEEYHKLTGKPGEDVSDENKRKAEDDIYKLIDKTYNVVTVQSNTDLAFRSNTDENEASDTLRIIRSIWCPFHFLPGGMKEAEKLYELLNHSEIDTEFLLYQRWRYWNDDKYRVRNKNDAMLICRHTSDMSKAMLEMVAQRYKYYLDNGDKISALYAVGIGMHVLADTWSHQGFAGTCSQIINQGSMENAHTDVGRVIVGGAAVPFSNVYSPTWTGHGSVGTNPDIPGNKYTYISNYAQKIINDDKILENQKNVLMEFIKVNNLERFTSAFYQMYDVLYSIKNNIPIPEASGNNSSEIKKEIDTIQRILFTNESDEESRCEKWRLFLHGKFSNESVDQYNFSDGNSVSFINCAREHRDFIMAEISEKLFNASSYKLGIDLLFKNEIKKFFKDKLD